MASRTIETSDGVMLSLTDSGGPGTPIVLIAGFHAPSTVWTFQVDSLLRAGHRVICLDRRSHGRSERPTHGHRMARHGKDLRDALDQLALGSSDAPVMLVGASMGASVIWAYVDLFDTDGVTGIVSVDQTPAMTNTPGWGYGFYGLTTANEGGFFDHGVPWTGRGLTDEQAALGEKRLRERLGPGDSCPPGDTAGLLADHARQDWRDVISRTTVPLLMVAGRQSQFWPCEHAAAAIRRRPNGRALVIDDSGHAVHLDQPQALNDALKDHLGQLS